MKSELQKEFVRPNIEGFGELHQDFNCGSALTALNAPHVIGMDVRLFGKSLLAQPCLLSALENRFANDLALKWLKHFDNGNKI